MNITNKNIDSGKEFDWGKTSADYARFRDIYPQEFYDKMVSRQLCISGQSVLDVGTGTGVLPRNMYRFGAKWTGTGIMEFYIDYQPWITLIYIAIFLGPIVGFILC